jgi:predicted ATPase
MTNKESLQIYTLGDLRILRGGEPIAALRSRKAQAMLVYLASTSMSHSREVLADLFWSESSLSQAMSNLRDVIHITRKHLELYVDITRYSVALNPEAEVWMDVVKLDDALELIREGGKITVATAVKIEAAVELYQKDFLAGFYVSGARGFEEWLTIERERTRQVALDVLLALVEYHASEGNYQKGIYYARRILELEPMMEIGHQHLMRMLASSGRGSEAMSQYETCRQVLLEELGIEPSEETQMLYRRISEGKVKPGVSVKTPKHNLPVQSTSLIGRDKELSQINRQLVDPACRLLTLTGVGGIGKTRLGLQAAVETLSRYPDGVWLMELAAFTEPDLLPEQIASVFGVTAQEAKSGRGVTEILVEYLGEKNLLLVLDNCEHLIEACADFVESLLRGCPNVKLLVTSREELGVPGEWIFNVPPLELPPEHAQLKELEWYPSIRLFLERAAVSRARFRFTEQNGAVLAEICRQLDGIPLAIELAAARVRILSLEQITERLQDRFQLLTGGPRTALPRHQTLQATMDWSYDLLSREERALLRWLSVFSGGWTLEAAEEVAAFGDVSREHVLDLLEQLVDKSLVVVDVRGHAARYGMLEMVRQYGVSKLIEEGEVKKARRGHAKYFARLAEHYDMGLRDRRQLDYLEVLDVEHENLRIALKRSVDNKDADTALHLVGSLGWYWFIRGHWAESWRGLTMSLELDAGTSQTLRSRAIYKAGGLELIRGNLVGTVELVEDALDICRTGGDEEGVAWCLNLLGQARTWDIAIIKEAIPFLSESLEIFNALGDDWGVAWSKRYLGQVTSKLGEYDRGMKLQREGLNGFEQIGDIWNTAHSYYLMGESAYEYSDFEVSRWANEQCLEKCELVEDKVMEAHAQKGLAQLALQRYDFKQAEDLFLEAIETFGKIGDENCAAKAVTSLAEIAQRKGDLEQTGQLLSHSLRSFEKLGGRKNSIGFLFERFANLAEATGRRERAARLLGAADTHLGAVETLPPTFKDEWQRLEISMRKLLGDKDFEKLFAEGAAMNLREATAYALEESRED